ncbi:hypothetical protein [Paenibacillus sp. MBLB4367]|uniref:hypothetical protein n=1 Tax=Paenibacillus sp. MBLB4367 TaxID=3384767 RepID=UPI00390817DC
MRLFILKPEVAGGFGDDSVIIRENGIIKEITHLHYEFEGWLGDDLLKGPGIIVTRALADAMVNSDLNGYNLKDVQVSSTDMFKEMYPGRELPEFRWLVPLGEIDVDTVNRTKIVGWSGHDICLIKKVRFAVSEKALELFKKFKIEQCEILELSF